MKSFLQNPHLFEYYTIVILTLVLFGATFFEGRIQSWRKWLGIALMLMPVLYFFILFDAHAINIPFTDDFNLLETVLQLRKKEGFSDKIKLLFEQVNQHRFGFERVVMLIMVWITGTVNVKLQIFIGNLFLFGIGWLLFISLKKESISWYFFIPVPFLLFNLIFFENAYWGIAALQNTPLLFFAFLTAYGLARQDGKGMWIALIAAVLTTFTSGSGMLTWIIGVLLLAFQRRWQWLAGWVLAAVAILSFYFFFDYLIIPAAGESVFAHPVFNAIFVMAFWGNALFLDVRHPLVPSFHPDLIWCVMLGAGIALIFAVWGVRLLLNRKQTWSDWFLGGSMMFALGTGAMFVISRPINDYVMRGGTVFSRRYMIFGVVLLATCYVFLIVLAKNSEIWKKRISIIATVVFIALNFVSYFLSIVQIRRLHDELAIDSYFWKNYNTLLSVGDNFTDIPFWNHPTRMKNLIKDLEAEGLTDFYQFYNLPSHRQLLGGNTSKIGRSKAEFDATSQYRNGGYNIRAKYFNFWLRPVERMQEPVYFVLESPAYNIVLPAVPVPHQFPDFLRSTSYYSNNFQYSLFKPKLPQGTYRAWYMARDVSGKWQPEYTGKKVLFY